MFVNVNNDSPQPAQVKDHFMFMSSFDSTIIEEFIVTLIFDIYKRIIYIRA